MKRRNPKFGCVRESFLMIRMVARYLDLFAASEPRDAPDRRQLVAQA